MGLISYCYFRHFRLKIPRQQGRSRFQKNSPANLHSGPSIARADRLILYSATDALTPTTWCSGPAHGRGSQVTARIRTHGVIMPPVRLCRVRLSKVLLDSGNHPTQSLHIGNVVLILYMGKDQTVVILGEGKDGTKLTGGMTLALLDDGDIRLMQRMDPIPGGFAGEHLFRRIDNLLPERDQAIEFSSRFLETPAVEAVYHPGGLLDHMASHVFEVFDCPFLAFRISPAELLDPEKEFLSGSAKAVKGLPEGYLLTNPLDLSDNLLSNPVKKIGVRRIGNVLGLGGGVYRHPSGFHRTHLRPRLEQYRHGKS